MRRTILIFAAAAAAALSACSRSPQSGVQPRAESREPGVMQQGSATRVMRGRVTDNVLVVSIDGLRPDAIAKFHATTLERLMARGR